MHESVDMCRPICSTYCKCGEYIGLRRIEMARDCSLCAVLRARSIATGDRLARLDKAATLDRGCWGEAFHFVEQAAERQGLMQHSRNRPVMIQN